MKICFYSSFSKYFILLNSILIIISVFTVKSLWAHKIGESYIYLRVYEDKLTGIFHITLGDLNKALAIKRPDAQITGDNIADRISEVHSYYRQNVQFFDGENELPIRFTGLDMMPVNKASSHPGNYVLIEFAIIENSTTPKIIGIEYNVLFNTDPDHIGLLGIEYYWRAGIFDNKSEMSLFFSPENRLQQLPLAEYTVFPGFISIIKLGILHIWKGIDHILFIIALLLPAAMFRKKNIWEPVSEFRPAFIYVVKIITLFTVAHCLTFCIAALDLFSLPTRLVESVIAISIAVAALHTIIPVFKRTIGWVVFIFGLFHGFGFASILVHIGVLSEHIPLSLLGSSLGVAIGLVSVICLIFPNLYLVRQSAVYSKVLMRYSAFTLILFSVYWTVDRVFLIGLLRMLKISFMNIMK